MYGTIARLHVKPGSEDKLKKEMSTYDTIDVPGFIASMIYKSDDEPDVYWLTVAFEDRASYKKNAEDPAQDQRYKRMRDLLVADPEWHDGEIVTTQRSKSIAG